MLAREIMSTPVVSVMPSQPVAEIAALLRDRRIGGMPVIDHGKLVGMVTELDLIHRHEIGTDQVSDPRPWWRRMRREDVCVRAYVKSHGRIASYVMATPVHVVDDSAELPKVASVLDFHRVGRVPVMRGNRVVGIIARADLVRALARQPVPGARTLDVDDETIRQRLVAELSTQRWWHGCWENVSVAAGVVTLNGFVDSDARRLGARVAAENVPGVMGVQDNRVLSSSVAVMV
jgi:predicted transcriptional regulator